MTNATPEPAMFCRSCSYVLNGLEGNTCPECGTSFDRNDPNTWKSAVPSSRAVATSLALLLVFWHCATVVAGGHGIGVVGLLYANVFGLSYESGDWSLAFVLTGWGGLLLSVGAVYVRSSSARRTVVCSVLPLLAISEVYYLAVSELGVISLVSSIPFWITTAVAVWVLAFKWPRR